MTIPDFGLVINENNTDPLPPVFGDFSVGGIVLPSEDADASIFPLNTAIDCNLGDQAILAALGTGPLYKAVKRALAQLQDLEQSIRALVVRVATGVDDAHTMANILGDPAQGTGIYALLKAAQSQNVTPRLIIMPGFTGLVTFAVTTPTILTAGSGYTHPLVTFNPAGAAATATPTSAGVRATGTASLSGGGVGTVAIVNPGTLYQTAPTVSFSGGGGTGATAHATILNGIVTGIIVDTPGTGYTSAPTVTLAAPPTGQIGSIVMTSPGNYAQGVTPTITIADSQGGTGTGATASITMEELANPLCAALPDVLESMLAVAIVGGPGGTKQDAINWRNTLSSDRLIPVDDWEIISTEDGLSTEYIDGAAKSLGLAVRTDFLHDGYPFHAWANVPVQGALGMKRIDSFSIIDGATDGQELLSAGVGITVRGDLSDTSLDDSGFVHVSYRNAATNPLTYLYNKRRGNDFINLALIKSIRRRLGNNNITLRAIDAVLDDMTAINVDIQAQDDPGIVGFKVGFKSANNTVEGLRAGKFTVYNDTEIPAPILQITIDRGLDRDALVAELAEFGAATSTVTG